MSMGKRETILTCKGGKHILPSMNIFGVRYPLPAVTLFIPLLIRMPTQHWSKCIPPPSNTSHFYNKPFHFRILPNTQEVCDNAFVICGSILSFYVHICNQSLSTWKPLSATEQSGWRSDSQPWNRLSIWQKTSQVVKRLMCSPKKKKKRKEKAIGHKESPFLTLENVTLHNYYCDLPFEIMCCYNFELILIFLKNLNNINK